MENNLYKILEVDRNATQDELKKSYRRLSKKYHPDVNSDKGAEDKFKEVASAYEILSDPTKKQNYDTYGSSSANPFTGGSSHGYGHGFSMDDILSQFGDIFGGGFKNRQKVHRKGSDLRIKVQLSLNDIINGVKKKLKFRRYDMCNPCNGKGGTDLKSCSVCSGSGQRTIVQNTQFGQMRQVTSCNNCSGSGKTISNKCSSCQGEGVFSKEEIVDVEIPAGVSSGMSLCMGGFGNYTRDGIPGDLNILIEEIPDPIWQREKNNLKSEIEISVIDAILGKNVQIDTPHGKTALSIPEGTDSGKVIRFGGKGINDVNYGLGDMYVKINVKIPKKINLEEKMILEKLRGSKNFNI